MSQGGEATSSLTTAGEGGYDHFSALPDDPLRVVLSFLPSRDAVRTSVLARRWRDQWKYVPAVRITDVANYHSANQLNSFINQFLHFRGLPVSDMEIDSYDDYDTTTAFMFMEQWVRYGLSNGARSLHVYNSNSYERWHLPDGLLISRHLTRLELVDLYMEAPLLDFSSCPALKDLKVKHCAIEVGRILSPSVLQLSIT